MENIIKKDDLLSKTDTCVKCGLCLPHCPTYQLEQQEAESPRGRINLIQGLASNALLPDSALQQHLENCLKCARCETACPAQVPFTELLYECKAWLNNNKTKHRLQGNWLLMYSKSTFINKSSNLFASYCINILPKKILLWLMNYQLINYLFISKILSSSSIIKPQIKSEKPYIGLFIGCTGHLFARNAINATASLLNQLGYNIYFPKTHHCCGGLLKSSGKLKQARQLEEKNTKLFKTKQIKQWISIASGCHDFLKQSSYSQKQRHKLTDIYSLIIKNKAVTFKPFPKKIALFIPCSFKKDKAASDNLIIILKKIPQAKLILLEEQYGCCGASGMNALTQPQKALSYVQPILNQILQKKPDLILSNNTGCTLHLSRALMLKHAKFKILHPNELLSRLITPGG